MKTSRRILVVGAGFAGACYARLMAEAGLEVIVIDKRAHVGGNAYDFVDDSGTRVHRYGPHLFHTNNECVVRWLSRWGEWVPYFHRVRALLPSGATAPLPINRRTIEIVFDVKLSDATAAQAFLESIAESIGTPRNAAEFLYSRLGKELTELFFRPYTKKMWALDLEDLDASVVKRLPLRFDDCDYYFPNDRYQIMPRHGYAAIFEEILAHPNIDIQLKCSFQAGMETDYWHAFLSLPIDEFYSGCYGPLPYRSIKFEHAEQENASGMTWAVTNYTGNGDWTRQTAWHMLPHHSNGRATSTHTRERPCDYTENCMERFYPVRTSDGRYQKIYDFYADRAAKAPNLTFIGRCGTYQYLDMHQVINQSLMGAEKWLRERSLWRPQRPSNAT